jgi:hypothetical protein
MDVKHAVVSDDSRTLLIGTVLDPKWESVLVDFLKANLDVFAWKPSDMKGIPEEIAVRHGYPWVPTDQAHGRPGQVGPAY